MKTRLVTGLLLIAFGSWLVQHVVRHESAHTLNLVYVGSAAIGVGALAILPKDIPSAFGALVTALSPLLPFLRRKE